MIPYFVAAVIVGILSYLANGLSKMFGKWPLVVGAAAIVAFLSLMAGFRAIDVGTDVTVYGLSTYRSALSCDFRTFLFDTGYSESVGVFCLAYMWVAARLLQTFSGYLAALAFVTVLPVVVAAFREGREWAPLVLAVFCLVLYPASYNMMRQYMAMGFVLLAYMRAKDKDLVGYLLCLGVAILFHGSAFIALPVYWIVQYGSRVRLRGTLMLVMCAVVALSAIPQLFEILSSVVGRYAEYLVGEHSLVSGGRRQRAVLLLCCLICLSVYLVLKKRPSNGDERPLAFLCFFGVLGFCLSFFAFYLYRVGFYYLVFLPLLAASAVRRIEGKPERFAFVCVVVLASAFFFYQYYYVTGANEVIPYVLDIKRGL